MVSHVKKEEDTYCGADPGEDYVFISLGHCETRIPGPNGEQVCEACIEAYKARIKEIEDSL